MTNLLFKRSDLTVLKPDCTNSIPAMVLSQEVFSRDRGWAAANGYFYRYLYGCWHRMEDGEVKKAILYCLEQCYAVTMKGAQASRYGNSSNVREVFDTLLIRNHRPDLQEPRPFFVFQNGTLNLLTGRLEAHDPDHAATVCFGCDWFEDAALPPAAADFFDTCYGQDRHELLRAVLRLLLDPTMPYGVFVFVKGKSGTGKGLLMRLLDCILPEYRIGSLGNDASKLADDEGRQQAIAGRQLVFIRDLVDSKSLNAEVLSSINSLVDNEKLGLRRLFKDDSPSRSLHCRLVISSTRFPTLRGGRSAEEGWARRCFYLDTLPRSGAPNRNLLQPLESDPAALGKLVSWVLAMDRDRAWQLLNKEELDDRSRDLLESAAAQSDSVAAFLDQHGRPNGNTTSDLGLSYKVYRWWALEEGHRPVAAANYKGQVREKLPACSLARRRNPEDWQGKRLPAEDRGWGLSPALVHAWAAATNTDPAVAASLRGETSDDPEGWLAVLQELRPFEERGR